MDPCTQLVHAGEGCKKRTHGELTLVGQRAGLVVITMVYQVLKNRGFRGALFGAPVDRFIGEMQLQRRGIVKTTLRVHKLVAGDEAQQLAELLSRAAKNA